MSTLQITFFCLFLFEITLSYAYKFDVIKENTAEKFPENIFNFSNYDEQVLYSNSPTFQNTTNLINPLIEFFEYININFPANQTGNEKRITKEVDIILGQILPKSEYSGIKNMSITTLSSLNNEFVITTKYSNSGLKKTFNETPKSKGIFSLIYCILNIISKLLPQTNDYKRHISISKWFYSYSKTQSKNIRYLVNISSSWKHFDESKNQNIINRETLDSLIAFLDGGKQGFGTCRVFTNEVNNLVIVRLIKWEDALMLLRSWWNLWETVCPGLPEL